MTEPFGYIIKPFDERELHTTIEIFCINIRPVRRSGGENDTGCWSS
jgi:hypothetical protein